MTGPLLTVAEGFTKYLKAVELTDAPPEQVEELRRVWYAASYITLMSVMDAVDAAESDEAAVALLGALKAECEAYGAQVGAEAGPDAAETIGMVDAYAGVNYTTPDAPQFAPVLRKIGGLIKPLLPPGWAFTLMIFPIGEGGSLFYISTAERASMIEAMQEFIRKNTS